MSVTRPNAGDVFEGGAERLLEEAVFRFLPPERAKHPATPSDRRGGRPDRAALDERRRPVP